MKKVLTLNSLISAISDLRREVCRVWCVCACVWCVCVVVVVVVCMCVVCACVCVRVYIYIYIVLTEDGRVGRNMP